MNNLTKRILAAFVGIPLIIISCYMKGIVFLIFALIVSSLALWEFLTMLRNKDIFTERALVIFLSVITLILNYFGIGFDLTLYTALIVLACAEIFKKENNNPFNVAAAVFGMIYITIPFMLLSGLLDRDGLNLGIYIFVLIWTCDTFAYFGGRLFGRHKLSSISPNKTIEGAIAGFVFTIIAAIVFSYIFPDQLSMTDAIITGTLIGLFAQAGDLFESLLKRYTGVKDSSDIIPGHGGILDRFDSIIFVVPLMYFYFSIKDL